VNSWFGIATNAGKRLPKFRAVKTSATSYTGSFVFVPYQTIDTSANVYNPDNEWFSIPGTGLPTARRVIVNKDGEYHLAMNLACGTSNLNTIMMAKLVNDNTMTGATIVANGITATAGNLSVIVRLAAGESVGCAWAANTTASDQIDGSNSLRNDFTITRLSD
jgi:hypothetical protein